MKIALLLICFFPVASISAFSQQTIKGRVITAKGGTPLPGSSVFITNTSKGTTADKNGYFELNDVPTGRHELIISSIGYETNVFSFNSTELPLQLRVEMELKVQELKNVTVEAYTEEGWDKWGKTFLDNFIGMTANAAHCSIKNHKAIKFRYYKKTNRVTAYCDEPVIIENKALGYIISFQLEDFEVNFKEHTSIFTGYPLFEEIERNRRGLIDRWKRNRTKAYYGSMMHFMRCVYNNSLATEGFEVRRLVKLPNTEKERVRKLYRPTFQKVGSTTTITMGARPKSDTSSATDSTEYYERILRQNDVIDIYGKDLLTADSLVVGVEGGYKVIYFDNYLYIRYKHEIEEEGYINFYRESRRPTIPSSFVTIRKGEPIATDINGNYFPAAQVFSGGYWGWNEKIANLLPLDFKPN